MKNKELASDTAERIEENVHNLPITSLAVAGLVGAGIMALSTVGLMAMRHKKTCNN